MSSSCGKVSCVDGSFSVEVVIPTISVATTTTSFVGVVGYSTTPIVYVEQVNATFGSTDVLTSASKTLIEYASSTGDTTLQITDKYALFQQHTLPVCTKVEEDFINVTTDIYGEVHLEPCSYSQDIVTDAVTVTPTSCVNTIYTDTVTVGNDTHAIPTVTVGTEPHYISCPVYSVEVFPTQQLISCPVYSIEKVPTMAYGMIGGTVVVPEIYGESCSFQVPQISTEWASCSFDIPTISVTPSSCSFDNYSLSVTPTSCSFDVPTISITPASCSFDIVTYSSTSYSSSSEVPRIMSCTIGDGTFPPAPTWTNGGRFRFFVEATHRQEGNEGFWKEQEDRGHPTPHGWFVPDPENDLQLRIMNKGDTVRSLTNTMDFWAWQTARDAQNTINDPLDPYGRKVFNDPRWQVVDPEIIRACLRVKKHDMVERIDWVDTELADNDGHLTEEPAYDWDLRQV